MFSQKKNNIQGVGVGLRSNHFSTLLNERPCIPWLEVLADNFLHSQGILLEKLQQINADYPMVLHSIGLSIGGTDTLNMDYLAELKRLKNLINAPWISDHLCWSYHQGNYSHELLPLPFTQDCLEHIVQRIQQAQDYLQERILIENISSYLQFNCDSMPEAEFLATIAEKADCFILLDVNNLYVTSQHHLFDTTTYLDYLDPARIKQLHLGGYSEHDGLLIDTHGEAVHTPVWELYKTVLQKFGVIPTCIEWDNQIPEWSELQHQQQMAQTILLQTEDTSCYEIS